ncbi:hypothetical protein [Pseudomonas sp. GM55]|uniref:hypothetical protein n=1 Tax=Pseudomonas sp. GM55 TaxID=1144333 RepID=UPI000270A746|nr:hypothetical protein [Pseudomonas sp. GM55]EJM73367.1 hypothetical protein PMI31_03131 [Pseudomonas sp. GM55]
MTFGTFAQIANESLDTMECSRDHLRWLSALGKAIHTDLSTGHGLIAKDLADLAQYLADDHRNNLDDQFSQLNDQLEAIELRA